MGVALGYGRRRSLSFSEGDFQAEKINKTIKNGYDLHEREGWERALGGRKNKKESAPEFYSFRNKKL